MRALPLPLEMRRQWFACGWRRSLCARISVLLADVYNGYKTHAFPHDELRPVSKTYTDSLVELGATTPTRAGYSGVALTLIDSLDTLAMLDDAAEFAWAVRWIAENVSFDLAIEVCAHLRLWRWSCRCRCAAAAPPPPTDGLLHLLFLLLPLVPPPPLCMELPIAAFSRRTRCTRNVRLRAAGLAF